MLRMVLPAALLLAGSAAVAGDVPVLPGTPIWIKSPTGVYETVGPRDHGLHGVTDLPQPGTTAADGRIEGARATAAPVVAGLGARDRARLAARIEAELATRTR